MKVPFISVWRNSFVTPFPMKLDHCALIYWKNSWGSFYFSVPLDTTCSLCGADTQSPDFKASDHGENLCGRGTISCPLCAKTFSLWSHYEAHKKCHQKLKQRQYPCQTCGKVRSVYKLFFFYLLELLFKVF